MKLLYTLFQPGQINQKMIEEFRMILLGNEHPHDASHMIALDTHRGLSGTSVIVAFNEDKIAGFLCYSLLKGIPYARLMIFDINVSRDYDFPADNPSHGTLLAGMLKKVGAENENITSYGEVILLHTTDVREETVLHQFYVDRGFTPVSGRFFSKSS